jgi:RNA polymerase sigma-70 factor, ECF subfamily
VNSEPSRKVELAGRRFAFDEVSRLYEQHGPALVAYARSFLWDAGVAEDVVHGVFLKLLRGQVAMPDVPLAYLYRAVRNTALNARRDEARQMSFDERDCCFESRDGNREAALALEAALRDLPEEQREVLIMRVWSQMTSEEVAIATGVPLDTAASRYRYGLAKLRERLKPFHKE